MSAGDVAPRQPRVPLWNNPAVRGAIWQAALLVALVYLAWNAVENAAANMRARNIPTSFDFWNNTAGFDVNQTLIEFSAVSTYGRAFLVGLLNTLLVAGVGVVLATIVGFIVGIARLSTNWIVAKLATIYVETIRNVPLLLQLLFWYNAVLAPLPLPRGSISIFDVAFLNNRGLVLPEPKFSEGAVWIAVALAAAIVAAVVYALYARAAQRETGAQKPVGLVAAALIVGLPVAVYFLLGRPLSFELPVLRGFNFGNGVQVRPEFVALVLGLVLYTASFIAEIVRAGIQSVPRGQIEAAHALGLRTGATLKLVTIPQAMRVITPPLTNQYLNLTKNSSLAVFIGYPDLVQVFMGTVLNQTGAAVQVIAITMAVYLVISLSTSLLMDIYNRRMSLRER